MPVLRMEGSPLPARVSSPRATRPPCPVAGQTARRSWWAAARPGPSTGCPRRSWWPEVASGRSDESGARDSADTRPRQNHSSDT